MAKLIKTRIRHKIDIEANWELNNPILRAGEIGFTSDGKHKNWFKLGDGVTPWIELQYAYSEFLANLIDVDNLTIEMNEEGKIAIKDTGVVAGDYGSEYDEENNIFTIPSFTVNSKGQLTSIEDKRVQIKQTMNVIPVTGEYTISSNYALITGKPTVEASCVVNVPKMPIGTQVVIKNIATDSALLVRPVDISIDGYTFDIALAPYEYITLVSISPVQWSIIAESSRFSTEKLSLMNLSKNIVVRNDNTGNIEQRVNTLKLEQDNIAVV